jgi:hypothetical protein
VAVDSQKFKYTTIVKGRKKQQEMLLRVMRALPVTLGIIMQHV